MAHVMMKTVDTQIHINYQGTFLFLLDAIKVPSVWMESLAMADYEDKINPLHIAASRFMWRPIIAKKHTTMQIQKY